MRELFKKIFMAGVPAFAVLFLIAVAFYAGGVLNSTRPNGKYLTAEKNAVIFGAVFDRQGETPEQLKAEVTVPVLAVLRKYADQGYVVIDTAKDEHGNMVIAALPDGTSDITAELAAAIKMKSPR